MDEPTTGLDVVTQALVLGEVRRLVRPGVAIVYVSHDLAVVAEHRPPHRRDVRRPDRRAGAR